MRTTFSSARALLNSRLYKRTSLGGGLFVRKESAAYRYITNDSMGLYFVMDNGNDDYSVYASNHGMIDREHRYCAIREDGGLSADALPLILASNAEGNTRLTSQTVNTLGKVTSAQQKIPYILTGTIKTTPTGKNTVLLVIGTPDEIYQINGHVEVKTLVVLGCNLIVHGDINVTDHIYAYCRSISAHHVTGGVDAIYAHSLHWTYTPNWNSVCSDPNGGCKEILHNLSDEMFLAMHDRNWITAYQKEKFLAQRLAISQAATNNQLLLNHSLQKALEANEAHDHSSSVASVANTATISTTTQTMPPAATTTTNANHPKAPNQFGNTNTTVNAFTPIDLPASERTFANETSEEQKQKLVEIDTTIPVNNFIDDSLLKIDGDLPTMDPAINEILANSITPAADATIAPTLAPPATLENTPSHGVASTVALDSSQPTSSLTLDHATATSIVPPTAATASTTSPSTDPIAPTTQTIKMATMPMTTVSTETVSTLAPSLDTAQPIEVKNVATNMFEIQPKAITETDVYKLLANPNTPLNILETIVNTLDGSFAYTPQNDHDYRKLAKAFILKLLRKSKQELLEAISSVMTLAQYEEQIAQETKTASDKAVVDKTAADRATIDGAATSVVTVSKTDTDKVDVYKVALDTTTKITTALDDNKEEENTSDAATTANTTDASKQESQNKDIPAQEQESQQESPLF